MGKKLYRVREDKRISGVCGGLANYLNIDPTIVRILWVVLTLVSGGFIGLIIYIACIFIIPQEPEVLDAQYKEKDE